MPKVSAALTQLIQMANAAAIDLGSEWTMTGISKVDLNRLSQLPPAKRNELADRLKGTVLYVPGQPFDTLGKYHRARRIGIVLREIARSGAKIKRGMDEGDATVPYQRVELPRLFIQQFFEFSPDGRMSTHSESMDGMQFFPNFARALGDVNATDIRTCKACKKIFPANRRNQLHCSNNCRQHHWRETHLLEAAEIQNRYDRQRDGRPATGNSRSSRVKPPIEKGITGTRARRKPRLPGSRRNGT